MIHESWYTLTEQEIRLTLRVTPNAQRNAIVGIHDGALKVKIEKPAVDGNANTEIIRFFSTFCGVSKSAVHILRGEKGRMKVVSIRTAQPQEIFQKLFAEIQ